MKICGDVCISVWVGGVVDLGEKMKFEEKEIRERRGKNERKEKRGNARRD